MKRKTKNKGLGRYSSPEKELSGLFKKSTTLDEFTRRAVKANYPRDFAERYYRWRMARCSRSG